MASPTKCPFCGQALDAAAAEHLHRSEERYKDKLGRDLKKEIRGELESEFTAREEKQQSIIDRLQKQTEKIRADAEKAFSARKQKIREEVEEEFTARQLKLQRMTDQQQAMIDRQQEEKEKLQREIDGLKAPDLGGIDEAWVFEHLSAAFHQEGDEIRREGKGGDIVQVVNYGDGKRMHRAGMILYEIKNTESWLNKYVEQIKNDGLTRKTPYLMLVSRKLPRAEKGMCVKDGVVIADQAHAVHLARILRRMVVEAYCAELAGEDHAEKTARLYEYLNSEEFRGEIGAVVAAGHELTDLLQKERRSHERTWTKREQAYTELERRSISIDETIQGIIQSRRSTPQSNGKKPTKATR